VSPSLTFKDRAFSVTVQPGHLDEVVIATDAGAQAARGGSNSGNGAEGVASRDSPRPNGSNLGETIPESGVTNYGAYLFAIATLYTSGIIDYAAFSYERSKAGITHLQGFVVFNESAFEKNKHKKPTEYLSGHWLKARNISGTRDYCAGAGIHVAKPDVIERFEFGEFIDPGWNQTLRMRLIYQLTAQIAAGARMDTLALEFPAAVLLVGEQQLKNLQVLRSAAEEAYSRASPGYSDSWKFSGPYCYIGSTELAGYLRKYPEITNPPVSPEEE
jgi:hypothetical protein